MLAYVATLFLPCKQYETEDVRFRRMSKMLHFIKLRTMSGGSAEKLLLQQTSNPLRRKVDLPNPLPANFTEDFITSFSEPLTQQTRLMDKQNTGWLVWGDSLEYYVVPDEDAPPIEWDASSSQTIEGLREIIIQASWWETFIKHLAMEKTVDVRLFDSFPMFTLHFTSLISLFLLI